MNQKTPRPKRGLCLAIPRFTPQTLLPRRCENRLVRRSPINGQRNWSQIGIPRRRNARLPRPRSGNPRRHPSAPRLNRHLESESRKDRHRSGQASATALMASALPGLRLGSPRQANPPLADAGPEPKPVSPRPADPPRRVRVPRPRATASASRHSGPIRTPGIREARAAEVWKAR